MKKNHLLLFILLLGNLGLKAQETIDNPPYKFRNTALYRIEKVECTDQDTKIYLRTEFIPGWWVQFSKEEINLKDNLGNRYQPLALEGAAWEEQKPTPASGTDHFIFTFPPLSSGVTSIDFLEGKSGIFDIRLTGDIPSVQTPLPTTLTGNWLTTDGSNRWTYGFYPEFVIGENRFWAYEKIETKGKKLILHLKSEGQDRQLLLSEQKDGYYKIGTSHKTQRLYKREDYRMEQVSGNQAEKSFFQPGSKAYIQGYIRGYDPRAGFTSGIIYNNNIVTEEDFPTVVALLEDGRFSAELSLDNPTSGNISFTPFNLPFYIEPGDTLTIFIDWEDLLQADRYRDRRFKDFQTLRYMGSSSKINADLTKAGIYIQREGNIHFREQAKQLTPTAFKIQAMQKLEDKLNILDRLNRQYHFSPQSMQILETYIKTDIATHILDFATTRKYFQNEEPENKILQAEVPQDYYDFLKEMPLNNPNLLIPYENWVFFNRFEYIPPFEQAYKISAQYEVSGFPRLIETEWKIKDSICYHSLQLEPNLSYDIIKIRDLSTNLKNLQRSTADSLVALTLKEVKNPYLRQKAHYLLEKYCPREIKASRALPAGKGADIFRKIIAPYQGKVIYVDFWATSCGPCRADIQNMKPLREQYSGKNIVFLFITDEKSSPINDYNRFTADLQGEKFRIPEDEYNYLRELFQINGIPHYEIINKRGEVVNTAFYRQNKSDLFDTLIEEQ